MINAVMDNIKNFRRKFSYMPTQKESGKVFVEEVEEFLRAENGLHTYHEFADVIYTGVGYLGVNADSLDFVFLYPEWSKMYNEVVSSMGERDLEKEVLRCLSSDLDVKNIVRILCKILILRELRYFNPEMAQKNKAEVMQIIFSYVHHAIHYVLKKNNQKNNWSHSLIDGKVRRNAL